MSGLTHFHFNGKSSLDFSWLVVNHIETSVLPPSEQRLLEIPGKPGALHVGRKVKPRVERIQVTVFGDSREDREMKKRILAEWLDTEIPRPFYYSFEPTKEYKAILSDDTDFKRIVTDGETTLTFIIPDPRAYGPLHSQNVAGVSVTQDTDTQSEWATGTLTDVVATANGLELEKQGQDFSNFVNTSWDAGTLVNVEEVNDDFLRLKKRGTDFSQTETNARDFAGTHSNTKIAPFAIYEDFNDGILNFTFTTPSGSDTGWSRITTDSFEGSGCFASNVMTPTAQTTKNARSEFSFTVPSGVTNAQLSMMYRVSSEVGYDFFRIMINGTTQLTDSGIKPWKKFTYNLTAETTYTVRLEYSIDGATSVGDNRAYVDDIRVTYDQPTANSEILLSNIPDYTFKDGLDNYMNNWRGAGTAGVTQGSGFVSVATDSSVATGLDKRDVVTFPFTIDMYMLSDGGSSIYISDGAKLFIAASPNTGGVYKWVRVRCINETTGYVYMDGALQQTLSSSDYTVNRILLFYNSATGTARINYLSAVYFAQADLGEQPPSFTGEYISQEYDITSVGVVNTSLIDWNASFTSPYTGGSQSIAFAVRKVDHSGGSPVYGSWVSVTDGGSIAALAKGEATVNIKFQSKVTFTTNDPGFSPELLAITLNVTSGYYSTGYRESTAITGVQQVGKAMASLFSWVLASQPAGTSIEVSVSWAFDGINYGNWLPVAESGDPFPGIDINTDLSKAAFKYKVQLNTTDIGVTPSVDRLDYSFTSAYKTLGERISGPVSLDLLTTIGSSFISWDTTPDADSNVEVYAQVVDRGVLPDPGSWIQLTNTGDMSRVLGPDGIGKELYTRQVLLSDGTTTPQLHRELWWVDANTNNVIDYKGSEISYPTLTITFIEPVSTYEIVHVETGDRVYLNRSFAADDVLVIDNAAGKVTVNGILEMPSLSSDFICLKNGLNSFRVSPSGVATVVAEWRERFK